MSVITETGDLNAVIEQVKNWDWVDKENIFLIGESGQKIKTVIYAHGANSNYKSDITTLKSLAESGIAC